MAGTQKTRIELAVDDFNIYLPDNNTQEIDPSEHRQSNENRDESAVNYLSDAEYLRELSNVENLTGVNYIPSLLDNGRVLNATQTTEQIVLVPDGVTPPSVFYINTTFTSVTTIGTSATVLKDGNGNIIPSYTATNTNEFLLLKRIAVDTWQISKIKETLPYLLSGVSIGQALLWDGSKFTNQNLPGVPVTPYIDKGNITGAFVWDVDTEPKIRAIFTGDVTLTITAANGKDGEFDIEQDGTGGHSLTLPVGSLVGNSGNGVVLLSSSPNAKDKLFVNYNGINSKFDLVENYN